MKLDSKGRERCYHCKNGLIMYLENLKTKNPSKFYQVMNVSKMVAYEITPSKSNFRFL